MLGVPRQPHSFELPQRPSISIVLPPHSAPAAPRRRTASHDAVKGRMDCEQERTTRRVTWIVEWVAAGRSWQRSSSGAWYAMRSCHYDKRTPRLRHTRIQRVVLRVACPSVLLAELAVAGEPLLVQNLLHYLLLPAWNLTDNRRRGRVHRVLCPALPLPLEVLLCRTVTRGVALESQRGVEHM